MCGEIVVLRQRQDARQLEGGVDHFHIRIGNVRREPFGGDEGVGGGVSHSSNSFSSFRGARSASPESNHPPTLPYDGFRARDFVAPRNDSGGKESATLLLFRL